MLTRLSKVRHIHDDGQKRICIVTPDYMSTSPRTVKEADALSRGGFTVRVVFTQGNLDSMRSFDQELLVNKPWSRDVIGWSPVRAGERKLFWKTRIRNNFFKKIPLFCMKFGRVAEYTEGRLYRELCATAARTQADLYIGHYPIGLAAAAFAASRWDAMLAYDAEDLHSGEGDMSRFWEKKRRIIEIIERRYLPRCSVITASSEMIARELTARYGVAKPAVIHNVFPWADRQSIDGKIKDRDGNAFSLYWFSQTIGPDRGIEDVIGAMALLSGENIHLHLRGSLSYETECALRAAAKKAGVENKIYFHQPVSPRELLSRAAEHDVGLALEQPVNVSRQLGVTNKFFIYLLAGLAIAATDIPAQKAVMGMLPEAGFCYTPGDPHALAERIREYIVYPARLAKSKAAALQAAREMWHWEKESETLMRIYQVCCGRV